MARVKRTEIPASRGTCWVMCAGRNRTMAGATTVRMASDRAAISAPDASRAPETMSLYRAFGWSAVFGVKVTTVEPFAAVELDTSPGVAGSRRIAVVIDASSMGWSKVTVNAESIETREPLDLVAASTAEVGARVRKEARAGLVIGRPVAARAPAPTVIV